VAEASKTPKNRTRRPRRKAGDEGGRTAAGDGNGAGVKASPGAVAARETVGDEGRPLLDDLVAVVEEHAPPGQEVDRGLIERAFAFAGERHAD
jgi:hypothetical protein